MYGSNFGWQCNTIYLLISCRFHFPSQLWVIFLDCGHCFNDCCANGQSNKVTSGRGIYIKLLYPLILSHNLKISSLKFHHNLWLVSISIKAVSQSILCWNWLKCEIMSMIILARHLALKCEEMWEIFNLKASILLKFLEIFKIKFKIQNSISIIIFI